MAIINCSECSGKVSSQAASCPHCGNPINPTKTVTSRPGRKWEAAGFILIVSGIFSGFAYPSAGGPLLVLGFCVFIIGRFK